ncbi:MAG: ATP-binding domain-containing protein, partial [Bacteroidales bacterium]
IDSLHSDTATLSADQQNKLFTHIAEDYINDYPQNVVLRKIKQNEYYNALQVKFAYCMTCHKAQGGQWKHVYIDLANLNPEYLGLDFYRWLYTAITRATERVYLVNMPDEMKG